MQSAALEPTTILDASPEGVMAFDANLRCSVWNQPLERLTGRTRESMLGRALSDILPEAADAASAALAGANSEATCLSLPVRFRPVRGGAGRITGVAGFVRGEHYRLLFDEAPVGYHELDSRGCVRRVNGAECELLGRDASEIVGRPVWEFVVSEEREWSRTAVLEKLSGKRAIQPFIRQFERADGSRVAVEVHERLIRDLSGRITGILTAVLDVTARLRADAELNAARELLTRGIEERTAELRQAQQRFTAFLEHLPGAAFIQDHDGRYLVCNAGCERLFLRPPHELQGLTDEELWTAERARRWRTAVRRVLSTGATAEELEEIARGKKIQSWLLVRFPIKDDAGDAAYCGGIAVDVSHRQELEAQFRQSQKMEAVGRLAGGVAHDFNNLLTVIGGYGRMALELVDAASGARPLLEQVLHAGERAALLTSQLLAFSRRRVTHPRPVDVNHLLENMSKLLHRVIGEDVQLSTRLADGLPPAWADPGQIEQVIMNLAVNARDAMPGGGRLTISTSACDAAEAALVSPQGCVSISVADNGVGMDDEVRSHLFEPFFTTKESGKGTGLGLSTVYGMVKQAGGDIRVRSKPGEGSEFTVFLPSAAAAEAAGEIVETGDWSGSETVLIAEDEEGVRRLASELLGRYGYRVLEAGSGSDAIRLAADPGAHIDLLLTDVIMPLMSGRELADRIQDMRPGLPVVYMSGYTDDVIAYRSELQRDARFLHKPFTSDTLARTVRHALDASAEAAS